MLPFTLRRPLASMNSLVALVTTAVVVQPVDQRADRRKFRILNDCGVIERAQQRSGTLEFLEQALVVYVEAERLGCRVEISAIDEQRDLV
jgi:hypothetical protein